MNTRSTFDKTKDVADRAGAELRSELEDLSAQVERLAGEITRLGKTRARSAKAGASRGLEMAERTLHGARRDLASVEKRAGAVVRNRPLESLGVAVLLGFVLALIFGRR